MVSTKVRLARAPSECPRLTRYAVSDVFHTSSPDSPFWEFKHGNGNFKRGDLVGLRDIKRRASRHTLAHRDSISSATKFAVPQNAPPAEQISDSLEARLTTLERNFFDAHARLTRSEETCANLNARCQQLSDTLMQSYQVCATAHPRCELLLILLE